MYNSSHRQDKVTNTMLFSFMIRELGLLGLLSQPR